MSGPESPVPPASDSARHSYIHKAGDVVLSPLVKRERRIGRPTRTPGERRVLFAVRLPPTLLAAVRRAAEAEPGGITGIIERALRAYVARKRRTRK